MRTIWISVRAHLVTLILVCSAAPSVDAVQQPIAGDDKVTAQKSLADAEWVPIEALLEWKAPSEPVAQLCWYEANARLLRELGLRFWDRFPDDPRRFRWLRLTVNRPPRYFLDPLRGAQAVLDTTVKLASIPIDIESKRAWNARYPGLRAKFLASPEVSLSDRVWLEFDELNDEIWAAYRDTKQGSPVKFSLADAQKRILAIGAEFDLSNDIPSVDRTVDAFTEARPATLANSLFAFEAIWKTQSSTAMSMSHFVAAMKSSPNRSLQRFALIQENVLRGRVTPVEMRFTALDGRSIDLSQMRGHIVLVDIWGTWCGISLHAMPVLKSLYAKYHGRGFEIIGIAMNAEEDRQLVSAVIERQAIPWPQVIDSDRKYSGMFGSDRIPAVVILDGRGLIVEDIRSGETDQLDQLIEKHLSGRETP